MGQILEERRLRFVYTTRNTEYHVFDGVCVGVRDLISKSWHAAHTALNRHVGGATYTDDGRAVRPSGRLPDVGEGMLFSLGSVDSGRQLITSAVCRIGRPAFHDLHRYPQP